MSFFMFYYTNKKIELIDTSIENNEENDIPCLKKYEKNVYSLISLIVIIVLSALSGFIISKNAVSITALIMLGVSYIVLLGAAVIDYKLKIIPNFFPLVLIISRILILIYEFIFTNTVVASFLSSLIGFFLSGLLFYYLLQRRTLDESKGTARYVKITQYFIIYRRRRTPYMSRRGPPLR